VIQRAVGFRDAPSCVERKVRAGVSGTECGSGDATLRKSAHWSYTSRTLDSQGVRPLFGLLITGWACEQGAALRAARLRR
jgi:hypothetical protein